MYQYIFDEDTTKKLNEKTNKSKTIFEQFSDVDNKYSTLNSTTGELNLEKMEFEKPTEEEVKQKAENSLSNYKNESLNSITDNYSQKSDSIDKSIQKVKEQGEGEKNEIYSLYQNAKQNAKDDAIKRGLARSSIIVNTLSNYENGMIDELNQKTNEITSKISEYENEKNTLEEEKQNALSSFNIEYAIKVQEKINDINEQIKAQEQEVLKYNNEITQLQAKWEKQQADDNFDKTTTLADLMGEHGTAVFDVLKQNEKYALLQNHFKTMGKAEAIEELTNNSAYISHIGRYNYNKLIEELNNRE